MQKPKVYRKLLILLLITATVGCAGTESTKEKEYQNKEMTLRQHLERMSGVRVKGTNENTTVSIRGSSSLMSNRGKQPLFVVDGRKMGRSFYRIASKLSPGEITSVEVLSGSGANMYGNQGGQGVIVIETINDK